MILKNQSILITGAGKGIGLASLYDLLSEGAFVFALVKSKSDYEKLKKENLKNAEIFLGNVNNYKLVKKILNLSISRKLLITGLVNNAGIRQRKDFIKITENEINHVFKVNFFSVFKLMQIFSNYIINRNLSASIVNIGSIVGQTGFKQLSGYASSKSALIGLTKSFATEMAEKNIRANLISPGFTKTSYFKKFKKNRKLYKWTLDRTPMKRWAEPNEISKLISFLLSSKSSFITGENINVDGGWMSS